MIQPEISVGANRRSCLKSNGSIRASSALREPGRRAHDDVADVADVLAGERAILGARDGAGLGLRACPRSRSSCTLGLGVVLADLRGVLRRRDGAVEVGRDVDAAKLLDRARRAAQRVGEDRAAAEPALERATCDARSPTNVTTNCGSGRSGAGAARRSSGSRSTGRVWVRTPSNASVAPHCPHANVTIAAGSAGVGTPWRPRSHRQRTRGSDGISSPFFGLQRRSPRDDHLRRMNVGVAVAFTSPRRSS